MLSDHYFGDYVILYGDIDNRGDENRLEGSGIDSVLDP